MLLMLRSKTNGNQQILRICRIVLVIFSHIYLFVSVKMNYFRAGVFSVFFTNTKINQKNVNLLLKINIRGKVAIIKHFPVGSTLLIICEQCSYIFTISIHKSS